jgi:exoribonuclease R
VYVQADLVRRKLFIEAAGDIEGRVDLTSIPSVCIDAKSTAFRDDAIGVRPRASTGRKVIPEASKWEILIHIADVSDIYVAESRDFVDDDTVLQLRNSAINRGMSRYDLPLGPLHLLPPMLLKSLGFVTNKPNDSSILNVPNRCVTLWAYIDERSGKVLDVGVERTLISSPVALTYKCATECLDNRDQMEKRSPLQKASAVLALAERNLELWSKQYKQTNVAARKRDERLAAKEIVAQSRQDGFQRSRGHRLVDVALDLYGVSLSQLLRQKKAPIPRASGSGSARMGRVATAPLRRMVDGMAQRQVLAVLCGYGGKPLTVEECREINAQSNEAMDRLANLRPLKRQGAGVGGSNRGQQRALAQLETRARDRIVKAVSTGRGNEISIDGAVGKCQGLRRNLKIGQQISVRVQTLNVEKGILTVECVE